MSKGAGKPRCRWCNMKNPLYIAYHDDEWGKPLHDDKALYELILLESFQAGLSWECILNKREAFRRAFDGFDIDKVCGYGDEKLAALAEDKTIVRNRRKIAAAVNNSRVFRDIQHEFGSFDNYLRSFTNGAVFAESYELRTTSPLSDSISADLKKRGMTFVGSTIIYAFLQAAGVIDAHSDECYLSPKNK